MWSTIVLKTCGILKKTPNNLVLRFGYFTVKPSDSGAPNKFVFKSSTVVVSVIKKPAVTSEGNNKVVGKADEIKQDGASKVNGGSSNVLQSLCQSYGDSEDED